MPVSWLALFTSSYLNMKIVKYNYPCMLKYYRKMTSLKKVWPANLAFVYLCFDLLQFKAWLRFDMFSYLGGPELTHQECGARGPGFDSRLRILMICFLFCCIFLLFCPNTLFVMKFCSSFCNFNSFSIHTILQNVWPIKGYQETDLASLTIFSKHISKHILDK